MAAILRACALMSVIAATVYLLAAGGPWFSKKQQKDERIDPAQVIVIRTPGGLLEVSTLVKNEEFGWSTKHTCPLLDCGSLLKATITEIRVPVHYTYRVPLAESWTLRLNGASYELTVPNEQPAVPAAIDLTKVEMRTSKGWLSPDAKENRETLLRQLGPELARRSKQPPYIDAQREQARRTVAEFAQKWMVQQGLNPIASDAIKVRFADEGAGSR